MKAMKNNEERKRFEQCIVRLTVIILYYGSDRFNASVYSLVFYCYNFVVENLYLKVGLIAFCLMSQLVTTKRLIYFSHILTIYCFISSFE